MTGILMRLAVAASVAVQQQTPGTPGWRDVRFRAMQTQFKQPNPGVYVSILVALAAVGAIFLLVKLLARWQDKQSEARRSQPWSLFNRLQSQLGLPLLDRLYLWRLARAIRLDHPAAMLISPQYFDVAVERFLKGRSVSKHARYTAIRERLFRGVPAPANAAQ
jgi:hypothetical protein